MNGAEIRPRLSFFSKDIFSGLTAAVVRRKGASGHWKLREKPICGEWNRLVKEVFHKSASVITHTAPFSFDASVHSSAVFFCIYTHFLVSSGQCARKSQMETFPEPDRHLNSWRRVWCGLLLAAATPCFRADKRTVLRVSRNTHGHVTHTNS